VGKLITAAITRARTVAPAIKAFFTGSPPARSPEF
jgi:hypothetical protein